MNPNLRKHFIPTVIPPAFEDISAILKVHNEILLNELLKRKHIINDFPDVPEKKKLSGNGAVLSYPIQGILKYHGMTDWNNRIAYFPSISFNNAAAHTKTYVEYDSNLKKDIAIINEKEVQGRDLERIEQSMNAIRDVVGSETKAIIVSKNFVSDPKAKGLGTSASGSAALAMANIEAALGKEYSSNKRFGSVFSRYVAGSGCRSITGGISLWLSYPGIESANSFSVRIDKNKLDDIGLVTVMVPSRIGLKTEEAHKDAPNSEFFKEWLRIRKDKIIGTLDAVDKSDWETIAQQAELDTIHLHGVTMSGHGGKERKIIAWEPETIQVMRKVNDLRERGIPVYYSIDTGPTPVLMTKKKYLGEVYDGIMELGLKNDVLKSEIGGPAEILNPEETKEELFTSEVRKIINSSAG